MNKTYDVVVVGGGVMGASAAFQLAGRGLSVCLVEKGYLAGGPTGRSSAIIRQHYSNTITAQMALYSLRLFQDFAEIVGGDCGYTQTGFVALAHASQREALLANVALQQAVGIRTQPLDEAALRELAPGLADPASVVAAYEPEGGYADPAGTTASFAAAAQRRGATVLQGSAVVALELEGGRLQRVLTSQGTLEAGAVVLAAGPWTPRLALDAGVELPIRACRVQVALFEAPPQARPAPVVFVDFPNESYFRPETGGLTLVGSVNPAEAEHEVDPDHYNEHIDFDFVEDAGTRLVRRFPCAEQAVSRGGYAALYDVTPDWHPIIGELLPGSACYVAAGHSGHGFKLSPAVGHMVADLVTHDHNEDSLDPTPFRLARFREGQPVRGRYAYSIAG